MSENNFPLKYIFTLFYARIRSMKKIEVGNGTFAKLIESENIYVDKTDILYNLITSGSTYFFCSRPRRFGKTLTISTLEAIFQGKKELFKGLKIYDRGYDWKEYPIIHIDFGKIQAKDADELKESLKREAKRISKEYSVEYNERCTYYDVWNDLLLSISEKSNLVVLIDEYDKILSSNIYNPNVEEMRDVLRGFFEVIKAASARIHFAFITGVTKFSKVSIFSSMNNLRDISMSEEYSTLFGYTEDELSHFFAEYIEKGISDSGMTRKEYLAVLARKYDGYRFTPRQKNALYNPVSIGNFFSDGGIDLNNYWIDSGNMMLLMEVAKKVRFDISKDVARAINKGDITSFDILEMASSDVTSSEYRSLLFQTGYLTITGIDPDDSSLLLLDFPNKEVSEAYSKSIIALYGGKQSEKVFAESKIAKCFADGRTSEAIERLKSIYEAIPYDLAKHANELYYSSIFFSSMKALGAEIGNEIETKNGRVDAILKTDKNIYVFEFKLDQSADTALRQIHDKGYANRFDTDKKIKTVHLVGINFSSREKNIDEWKEEIL